MKIKNYGILIICLVLFLGLVPVGYAQLSQINPVNNNYLEYPTETWIIQKQDYFSRFIEWDFTPVNGQSGDKLDWNFTWVQRDFVEEYNFTSKKFEYYHNPISEIKVNKNDTVFLESKFDSLKNLGGFDNKSQFVVDSKRLDTYNVNVDLSSQKYFSKQPIQHMDILNNQNGSFTFTLKQWQKDIYLSIGFGSSIIYSGATDAITVTGFTEGAPCTFTDVYDADVIGGWGEVSLQGTTQFLFDCKLIIGDGSTATWFADVRKQIYFSNSVTNATLQKVVYVRSNANFRLGAIRSAGTKATIGGCSVYIFSSYYGWLINRESSTALVSLYGSNFHGDRDPGFVMYVDSQIVWNCHFNDMVFLNWAVSASSGSIYNVIIDGYDTLQLGVDVSNIIFENLLCTAQRYGIRWELTPSSATFRDLVVSQSGFYMAGLSDQYLVDVVADNWSFTWVFTPGWIVYRQYSFNLKVVDQNGDAVENSIVELFDKNDNEVFQTTTLANGSISEQTVSYAYYNKAGGDVPYLSSPFTLNVTYPTQQHISVQTLKGIILDEPVNYLIDPKDEVIGTEFTLAILFVIILIFIPICLILYIALRRR